MPGVPIPVASENYRPGRPAGYVPDAIVLHRIGGSREALRARFNQPGSFLSAHYIVGRDGDVDECVAESDTAFHAGLVVNPSWRLLKPRVNPNFHTVGIELAGERTDGWPAVQLKAAAILVARVAARWHIALDADHVVTHAAIRASSACPGASFPAASLLEIAQAHATSARVPNVMSVRTLSRTNLRQGSPDLRARIVRVLDAGTELVVSTFTDAGARVQGSPFWYGTDDNCFFWAGATNVPEPADDPVLSDAAGGSDRTTDNMESVTPAHPPVAPPAASHEPAIDRTQFALPTKEYYAEAIRKDLIVLHFTAGTTARSAFETWRRDPAHVGTAYLVDRDGTIYEVFPPEYWAAHLGVKGTRNVHDRRSIGIEIANVGPLEAAADDRTVLNWWPKRSPGAPDFTTPFCRADETDRYIAVEFRGKRHFASFPEHQVDAVGALVRYLCARFRIPAALPPLPHRYSCDLNGFVSYRGVCSHANFRQDKWDIGPAFGWERLGL